MRTGRPGTVIPEEAFAEPGVVCSFRAFFEISLIKILYGSPPHRERTKLLMRHAMQPTQAQNLEWGGILGVRPRPRPTVGVVEAWRGWVVGRRHQAGSSDGRRAGRSRSGQKA